MNSNNIKYIAMDDTDIRHYLPKAKIITYDELSKVKDIETLLPHHKTSCIYYTPLKALRTDIGYASHAMIRP